MASLMQILRRIGGAKAPPTTGSAGQLALYKAGATPTDAMSLYAHDGTQWLEVLDTRGKTMAVPVFTDATTAPASPRFGDFWLNTGTNLLSIWDGATWLSTDPHPVSNTATAPTAPTAGSLWLDPVKKELQLWDGTRWAHVAFTNVQNTFVQPQNIDVNSASAALHIKQLGTGAALYIEDEANPDATPFVVDANGKMGIGTAAPAAELDVRGNVDISGSGATNSALKVYANNAQSALYVRQDGAGVIQSWHGAAGTFIAHIDGTTVPQNTRLKIKGSSPDEFGFVIGLENSAGTELFRVRNDGVFGTGVDRNSPVNLTTAAAANVYVTNTGSLCRSTSSLRYKHDVVNYDKGLDAVKTLRPVYYKQKNNDENNEPINTRFAGLIAEEVDAAGLKEFVAYDNQGRPDALQYANMVALLVKAVQELSAKVEKLEARP